MTSACVVIWVDVLNRDETETGRDVPVAVCYGEHTESEYGADADGNRGVLLIERIVLDHYIDPQFIKGLDSWQVERLITDADEAFYRTDF